MKAISFLGPRNYTPTTYCYEGKEIETPYFVEALAHFFPELERIFIFLTPTVADPPEGKPRNWDEVQKRLGDRVERIVIPEGHSSDDLWTIFNELTNAVQDNDTVIFDITHSFRSLPFLTFLAAAYLRTARQIKLHKILYGAFEAQDEQRNRTPVFDLTPFVGLLDWITATNQFIYTGDARYLARLLSKEGEARHSNTLKKAGEQLRDFSLAMMLCRPLEVMEEAGKLENTLKKAESDLTQWAQPFGLLANRIQAEYAARALPQPTAQEHVMDSLRQQLDLIHWYLENNQIIQAMTLAREWVITAVGWKLKKSFALELKEREAIERGLSGILRLRRAGKEKVEEPAGLDDLNAEGRELITWPESDQLSAFWGNLTAVRNELDHAGMNPSRTKAVKLAHKAQQEIWPGLETLAQIWGIQTSEESSGVA